MYIDDEKWDELRETNAHYIDLLEDKLRSLGAGPNTFNMDEKVARLKAMDAMCTVIEKGVRGKQHE